MSKRIEVRDRSELIGSVTEGGRWCNAPGVTGKFLLLTGRTYEQIERFFYARTEGLPPSRSLGRTCKDGFTFHFIDES